MVKLRILLCGAAAALALAGCARVGVPPGREAVDDDEPPRLKKIKTLDAYHVEVYFSEGMDEKTLRDVEHYTIVDEAGRPLEVKAAVVSRPDLVTLATDAQDAGVEYTLVARNVADAEGGNRIEKGNDRDFKGSSRRDEKPPAVVATFPEDGTEQAGLFPELMIEFTDVMSPVDNAADVIAVFDDLGAEVPGDGAFDGHRLRFRPGRRLDYATRYTVVVKDACADLAGNRLYRETRYTFATIEDVEEATISGQLRVTEEGVSAAGVEVRLSLSPDPTAAGAEVVGYAVTDDEGRFVLDGVSPNAESKASYHLVVTADTNGDGEYDLVGGHGYSGGKAAALPAVNPGEKLENVEVVLTRADVTGPIVEEAFLSPAPTAGQESCYIWATLVDAEGSAVAGAEVFFDEVWSDGTGIPLRPVGAEWGIAPRAAGERYVLDLHGRGVRKKGPHVLYVHGKDGAGNWGEFYEVPFDVTGPPRPSRDIAGRVSFEKLPAPGALVTARPEGDRRAPVAITVSDEKGLFTLEKLPPGRYDVNALLDEDEDGRWRRGEPEGVAAGVVDVAASDATGVDIVLTYGPSLSSANARIQSFAGDRAVLALSAAARDRDMDLARVWAELPGGIEVDLADDGIPPDDAAGDGIYKYAREYRGEEFAARPEGDVVIYAEDGRGNRVTATVSESPGLRLARVDAPSGLELYTGAEGLDVSWTPVENAWGGYVVFLVPADRLDRFTGPGTGEVYSNFRNPSYGTALTIPYDAVEDWWAYPAGSKFTVFVIASAGDADNYQASDKAIITAEWRKPATR